MTLSRRAFTLGAVLAPLPARLIAAEGFRVRDLWEKDMSFSSLATRLDGARVEATGFMAPPLKAQSTFFVLTNRPMSVCPFCETEAEWPDDIIAVHARRVVDVIPYNVKIVVSGRLALGTTSEADTGFVSRARIVEASARRA